MTAENGFLIAPQDVSALRNRLQLSRFLKVAAKANGVKWRLRYEEDFQIAAMVNKTLAIYNEVLDHPKASLADPVIKRQESLK